VPLPITLLPFANAAFLFLGSDHDQSIGHRLLGWGYNPQYVFVPSYLVTELCQDAVAWERLGPWQTPQADPPPAGLFA
jgi:hypothetical protein